MTLQIKTTLILFFAFTMAGFAQNNCQDLKGCERKICELKTKLEYAKKYNNTGQIRGLQKSIANIQAKCDTDTGTYMQEMDKKVRDKEKKVRERTFDLNEAVREKQKPEKIQKKRQKLDEAKRELEEAKKAKQK